MKTVQFKCINIRQHMINPTVTVYDFRFTNATASGYMSLYLKDVNAYKLGKVYTLDLADIRQVEL